MGTSRTSRPLRTVRVARSVWKTSSAVASSYTLSGLRRALIQPTASEWLAPAAMRPMPVPGAKTSAGKRRSLVSPTPSWPKPFQPQHLTPPPAVTAQVCVSAAETEVTPPPSPTTSAGTVSQPLLLEVRVELVPVADALERRAVDRQLAQVLDESRWLSHRQSAPPQASLS